MRLSGSATDGGLQCRLVRKPELRVPCCRCSRSHARYNGIDGRSRYQWVRTIRAERQVPTRQNSAQHAERQSAKDTDQHVTPGCLAAAMAAVALACTAAQPAEAFSKSGLSQALASAVRPKPADPEDQRSKRTAELAHAPEVCHQETTLSKASTAAVSEMRMRAALFDEASHKTAALRKRTSQFVDSMWQSLE